MVQVLPAVPQFGERLAEVLGRASANIGHGLKERAINKRIESANQVIADPRASATAKYTAFSRLPKEHQAAAGQAFSAFITPAAQAEQQAKQLADYEAQEAMQAGQQQSPPMQQQPMMAEGQQAPQAQEQIPAQRAIPGIGLTEEQLRNRASLQGPAGEKAKGQLKEYEKRGSENFTINEKHLAELAEKRRGLQTELSDYKKLTELSQSKNLPHRFSASLMTKDGNLNEKYLATLHPDAQEYLKVLVNRLRTAKDTFGARLTNFDVKTYLQGLPTFLNSPQGREQVLKGLVNSTEAELVGAEQIPKLMAEMGGSRAVPWSEVEAQFEERFAPQVEEIRSRSTKPASAYDKLDKIPVEEGRRVRNKKTGQVMVYRNGKWHSEGAQ